MVECGWSLVGVGPGEAALSGWERQLCVAQKWLRRGGGGNPFPSRTPKLNSVSKGTFLSLRLRRPPPKPQMRSAVVGRQAVLIQALGFRFCRAGSWAPDSCRRLPPGPPNGAAVRGDPEVGIEVGTKPGPCETGLEAKRPGLPLSSERKIGETAGGRRTRSSWYAGAPTRVLLRGFQSVYQVNLPLELA